MWPLCCYKDTKDLQKHPQSKQKYDLFVQLLGGMKAADQPEDVNSLSDYSRLWTDLIDRGGLYHIRYEINVCVCANKIVFKF